MGDVLTLTLEQLKETVQSSVDAAIRAVNTPDPTDRPPAPEPPAAPNVLRRGYGLPRLGKAMNGVFRGAFRSSEAFEKDVAQTAAEIWGYNTPDKEDDSDPLIEQGGKARSYRSVIWPKSREEMIEVLSAMGERTKADEVTRLDSAIRAMAEGTSGGGLELVRTQYLQDRFAYALVSTIAVRAAGIEVMPVKSNVVVLPRESTRAGASQANEAGTLSSADATLTDQTINVRKQYGFRRYSNELLADADPAWNEFLARTLVRDVALQQDLQYLEGTGSAPQIQGLATYGSVTTKSLGTNGASPTFDHFIEGQYDLRAVGAEPDFGIAHPRLAQSLSKIKDSTGNYLASNSGGVNAPAAFGTGYPGAAAKMVVLGTIPFWFSSQINITRTVGTSTDCMTVILGQKDQFLLLDRAGIEVAYSEHLYFTTDETAARAIGRSAIAIITPAAALTITGVRP